ncbi:MAG: type II toxin-antitoxin system RelE/ParE family toxin [Spirochaetia bacterium]
MIRSFASPETEKVWAGQRSTKLPSEVQRAARRKLRMLNNASELFELRSPPNNRLEKLKGNLRGLYSIRVNDQWRIVFRWAAGDVHEVQITDYH